MGHLKAMAGFVTRFWKQAKSTGCYSVDGSLISAPLWKAVGWPIPCPASTLAKGRRPFEKWLDPDTWEAHSVLAGSFVSDDIEDYYVRPWELGYGRLIKFDHDFIGREALEVINPDKERCARNTCMGIRRF